MIGEGTSHRESYAKAVPRRQRCHKNKKNKKKVKETHG